METARFRAKPAGSGIRAELALRLIGPACVIPLVVAALFSGMAADRAERRTILTLTVARGVCAFCGACAHLPDALSLTTVAWQLATVIGPALSDAFIAAIGVAPVYLMMLSPFWRSLSQGAQDARA